MPRSGLRQWTGQHWFLYLKAWTRPHWMNRHSFIHQFVHTWPHSFIISFFFILSFSHSFIRSHSLILSYFCPFFTLLDSPKGPDFSHSGTRIVSIHQFLFPPFIHSFVLRHSFFLCASQRIPVNILQALSPYLLEIAEEWAINVAIHRCWRPFALAFNYWSYIDNGVTLDQ